MLTDHGAFTIEDTMDCDLLAQRYDRINRRHSTELVFQLTRRGFASEVNNMILAILYCLEHGIEFRLCSRYWNAACSRGWEDYFLPFCRSVSNVLFLSGGAWAPEGRRRCKLARFLYPRCLHTHDVWESFRSEEFVGKRFLVSHLSIDGDIFAAKRVIAGLVLRLQPTVREIIWRRFLRRLAGPFIGMHIRRGDKHTEASVVPVEEYVRRARTQYPSINTVFVATDDYSVADELNALWPDAKIVTSCDASKRGHFQQEFNAMSSRERREETIRMLGDIFTLRNADAFVGGYSSNVARLVALLRGMHSCSSVDDPWHPL